MASKNKTKLDRRKHKEEIIDEEDFEKEDFDDEREEQPAGEYIIEQLGINPDELFAEESNKKKKSKSKKI